MFQVQLVDYKGQIFNYSFDTEAEYESFVDRINLLPQGLFKQVNVTAH